jgi:4-hydroxyphenylpyruvate dioxygenase
MLRRIFKDFGFSHAMAHSTMPIELWQQGDIQFVVNVTPGSFADHFQAQHGPCISAMGWRVANAFEAHRIAVSRGARPAVGDYLRNGERVPAIHGIGDSLIYFIDDATALAERYARMGFMPLENAAVSDACGFTAIDHLTNNVPRGTMGFWSDFYKRIFGFTEVRYFDIRGVKTGLTSYALRSPCGSFCIPINEGTDSKSQIDEYLREYRGPGVQHLAFLTSDIVASLRGLEGTSIKTLDIDPEYYREVFDRVPNVTEDHATLEAMNILVDGDDEGYLLQIFTKNLIGPIFIEIIQRKNHLSFGEGNFGALFRSIERDQEQRGVI